MAIISLTVLVIFWVLGSFISHVFIRSSVTASNSCCIVLFLVSLCTLAVASLLPFPSRYFLYISTCLVDTCWIKFVVVVRFHGRTTSWHVHFTLIAENVFTIFMLSKEFPNLWLPLWLLLITQKHQIHSCAYNGAYLYWFVNYFQSNSDTNRVKCCRYTV